MWTTKTHDVNTTLQQIAELTAAGCDIVRVACPRQEDADALAEIVKHSQIPVIADIHFQPKYIFAAIDAGCAAVRVNPGNIKEFDGRVGEVAKAAGAAGIPIRIGVNAGSLDKRFMEKYGKATPEALVESALWEASLFEEHGFGNIKISVKHNDPVVMVAAYELLAEKCDYPLHLGVTEAGPAFQGTIKSAVAFGALLSRGIGDTIRVSLSAPPVEEVKVGNQILESLNLRPRGLEIVSCPSAGAPRSTSTRWPTRCPRTRRARRPVTGSGDGLCRQRSGRGPRGRPRGGVGQRKGQIFVKGEVIKTVPEAMIVETLIEEAMRLADEMSAQRGTDASPSGSPVVTVSDAVTRRGFATRRKKPPCRLRRCFVWSTNDGYQWCATRRGRPGTRRRPGRILHGGRAGRRPRCRAAGHRRRALDATARRGIALLHRGQPDPVARCATRPACVRR